MKHRSSFGVKQEHSMIRGLRRLLERISSWEEIKVIIPGRITPTRGTCQLGLYVQYATRTGLKCLAKSSDSAQEVFFVSSNPNALREKIEQFARS